MILSKAKVDSVNLDSIIGDSLAKGEFGKILLVVPTNRKARITKKRIISSAPGKVITKINIETLGTLSTNLLSAIKPFNSLSEAASVVFIKQSAAKKELKYFAAYRHGLPFGTLDRIKNVINKYKENGISPDDLRREGEKLEGHERIKSEDIAGIYEEYLKRCGELNAYDIGDIYRELLLSSEDQFRAAFDKLYNEVDTIIFNGFDQFTSPEIKITDRLAMLDGKKLFLNFDYFQYNPLIFSHLDKAYEGFTARGFAPIRDASVDYDERFKSAVKEKLFRVTTGEKISAYKERITKIVAPSREKEIEQIAKEIKKLILEGKAEPSEICVAANLIPSYSGIFRDLFSVYGIPMNLTDRISLDRTTPVTAVISFLEILESDYYYKEIFRALSSGFIKIKGIDANNLLRVASDLKIVIGKENWKLKLQFALRDLGSDESEEYETERKRRAYEKASEDIETIASLLKPFEKKIGVAEFPRMLEKLISQLGIHESVLEESYGHEEKNIKALTTLLETSDEIFSLMAKEYGRDKKFSIRFFLEQIRTSSKWARFNTKERSGYGVLVTSVNEIRGLNFKYLFLCGMIDGDFPTRYRPEIFFSGSFRKKEQFHQTEERYHFYQALITWSKGLYLTYPLAEKGKELTISTFMKDFESLFEIGEKNHTDYKSLIYSKEEYLKSIGGRIESEDLAKDKILSEEEIRRIGESIAIEKRRREGESFQYSGMLSESDDIITESLSARKEKQYSVSELETYAKCPFKYFLERVLRLSVSEEPSEEVEAIEIGSLIHSVLFTFYSEMKKKGIKLAGCDNETFFAAKERLFEIAEKKIEKTPLSSPPPFTKPKRFSVLKGRKRTRFSTNF